MTLSTILAISQQLVIQVTSKISQSLVEYMRASNQRIATIKNVVFQFSFSLKYVARELEHGNLFYSQSVKQVDTQRDYMSFSKNMSPRKKTFLPERTNLTNSMSLTKTCSPQKMPPSSKKKHVSHRKSFSEKTCFSRTHNQPTNEILRFDGFSSKSSPIKKNTDPCINKPQPQHPDSS